MKQSRRYTRLIGGVAVAVIAIGSAVGCGRSEVATPVLNGTWGEVVSAAQNEGRIVLFNGTDRAPAQRVSEAFNEKYPNIEVQIEQGTKDMLARVSAQIDTGIDGADVFLTSDESFFTSRPDEFLPTVGPGVEGIYPESWVVEGAVANFSASPYSTFVWNTDRYPQGIDDWDDFLDPDLKGSLAIRGNSTRSSIGFIEFLESQFGPDYLQAIGNQDPKLYPSAQPIVQAVAAGEAKASMIAIPSSVQDLKEAGAPIDYHIPDEGFGLEHQAGALTSAHRPNAAMVFVDFLLSPEGQAAWIGSGLGSVARDGVPRALDLSRYTMLDASKYSSSDVSAWQARIASIFHQ
ncbi:ABC transporter substrate-binding protein [Rhodococcus sp. NPDC056743]|uniref:ABC transporter substrate-binding protein n=1 Tax=Rhodococcus sp. NPDC056743 TaxID=3345934 RepID=UPI00366BFCB6